MQKKNTNQWIFTEVETPVWDSLRVPCSNSQFILIAEWQVSGQTTVCLTFLLLMDISVPSALGALVNGAAMKFSYTNTFLWDRYIWDGAIPGSEAPFGVLLITRNAGLGLGDMRDVSCAKTRSDPIFISHSDICSSWSVRH